MITHRNHSVTTITVSASEALELIRQLADAVAKVNRSRIDATVHTFLEPTVLNTGDGHAVPGVVEFSVHL